MQVALSTLAAFSAVRLTLPKDLTRDPARRGVLKAMREVQRRFASQGGVPLLDPRQDMGIVSDSFRALSDRLAELQARLKKSALFGAPDRDDRLARYSARLQLLEKARFLRQQARESQSVAMREELRKRKRVLRRLGYISAEGVLGTKGRFSCELSTGDELVLTDMVFDGVFNSLSAEQAVALLSCFVHKEPSKDKPKIQADLQDSFTQLQAIARNIAKVCIDAKLTMEEEEYIESFNAGMMGVCFAWASGARFAEICALTDIFEGSIIRNIRRLEELLRQLASASLAIGNQELKALFESGADKIRRGVVFAASLYL